MKQSFIEHNIVILSKQTLDELLRQENPSDLIGLYCFYYYTAKWQETNQPKATIPYVAKGLKWGKKKVRQNKVILLKLGLISDVRHIDEKTKRVKGWYIKVNYIWKDESHPINFGEGGNEKATLSKSHSVASRPTNALSDSNINALSAVSTANAEKKDMNHNENDFSDSGDPVIEQGEQVPTAKAQARQRLIKAKGYDPALTNELLQWAIDHTGKRYSHPLKQKAHIAAMLAAGRTQTEITEKWIELEQDEYWSGKGIDFSIVASQIDKTQGAPKVMKI